MIAFALSCLGMLAVVALLLAIPLFKNTATPSSSGATLSPRPTFSSALTLTLTIVVIGVVSTGLYVVNTKWSWTHDNPTTAADDGVDVEAMVRQLADRLKTNPNDINGWLLLGRSYVGTERFALAIDAYQHAYDLSQGQNVDATTGLAEALLLNKRDADVGRASGLIDKALQQTPNDPRALWYGGLAALKTERLDVARDRFKALLALGPPDDIRGVLEREVQDLEQQLGERGQPGVDDTGTRKLTVNVTLSSALKQQLKSPLTLFVLVRDPEQRGPPLAVERHQSSELPLRVELTKADAMLPARSIDTATNVEVVARLSRSGAPMEQSGDYVGTAQYSFAKQGGQGVVNIEINRQVP